MGLLQNAKPVRRSHRGCKIGGAKRTSLSQTVQNYLAIDRFLAALGAPKGGRQLGPRQEGIVTSPGDHHSL